MRDCARAAIMPSMGDNEIFQRIEARLERLGMSAEEASKKAGMGRDGIRNFKRGKSQRPRGDNLVKLAAVLGVSANYLMTGELDPSMTPDLPVEVQQAPPGYLPVPTLLVPAKMGGGRLVEAEIIGPPRWYDEELIRHALRARPEDLRSGEVEGQSMEPLLRNRDRVIIDTRRKSLAEPGLFVLWDGEGLVCKWVQRVHGTDPARLKIISENKTFEPYEVLAEQAQIIGRVVWFARQL
jgi:transcriptional regulator with XRE-family HTH domain